MARTAAPLAALLLSASASAFQPAAPAPRVRARPLEASLGLGSLGPKSLAVPNTMGVSTSAWGDTARGFVSEPGMRGGYNIADLQDTYNTLVSGGVRFFATSEVHGRALAKKGMAAEQMLGKFADAAYTLDSPVVASDYDARLVRGALGAGTLRPRAGKRAVVSALQASVDRMNVGYLELYQLGAPTAVYFPTKGALWQGLAQAKKRGLANLVGVTGLGDAAVRKAHKDLAKLDVPLASNQVELSLVNRGPLLDGTVAACRELGVTVLARAPLGGGIACGKYTATNPTGGQFGQGALPKYSFAELQPLMPLHQSLEDVCKRVDRRRNDALEEGAARLDPVTSTQVALNWVRAKGAVPLPSVKTRKEAEEVIRCLDWELDDGDVLILDGAAAKSGR